MLTRASVRLPTSWFSVLDLPAFDRPTKAISGNPAVGQSLKLLALRKNSASMLRLFLRSFVDLGAR